ncbi:MAG: DUF1127 domain-containing protein [Mesorhizobium sp.]|nr:DUF1127 domain-containing protein [Mesorhizobium sp.]MBN9243659.1 DUF1127 domain-containing protein [Mesorhizobium sp.]MBN9271755.1 DUF1127 domain-containing protein [Mesorhizobium sp.]
MSAAHFAAETSRVAARPAATTRALEALSNLYRAWKNRRAFYRLGELSDTELADIGLTRADLSVAIDMPLGTDPTRRLRAIAAERNETIEDAARRAA